MARPERKSPSKATLLAFFVDNDTEWHGYVLMRVLGWPSGKLYPLLAALEADGYLTRRMGTPSGPGRPPRAIYRLTRKAPKPRESREARIEQQVASATARGLGQTGRYQVVPVGDGFAIQDTITKAVGPRMYRTGGWAARRADQLNTSEILARAARVPGELGTESPPGIGPE